MPVNTPHRSYTDTLERWTRCRDCYDGGDAVKAKKTVYLPELASHRKNPGKYGEYILRALFYGAMNRTVDGLAGAIMQREPTVKFVPVAEEDPKDITLAGEPLEVFAATVAREVLMTGRYGVLVDMMPEGEEAPPRPYWSGWQTESIINWQTSRVYGDEVLTMVVLAETVEEPNLKDKFVPERVEQFRVLELINGAYVQTIWRKPDKEWQAVAEIIPTRRGDPLPYIPFTFVGPTSVTPKIKKPPLLDLADVNLSHYRTMADLKHGLHYTGLPQPYVAGLIDNGSGPLEIGSGVAWVLRENGKADILQADGDLLGALEKDEERLRKMMAVLGARLLEDVASVQETLGAVAMRHSGEHATLRSVTQIIEQALTFAARWHGWWVGTEEEPEEVDASIELNKDFWAMKMPPQELQALVMALQADAISYETFYAALVKGEYARPGVTADEEKAAIDKETREKAALNAELFPDLPGATGDLNAADKGKGDKSKKPGDKGAPPVVPPGVRK